MNMVTKQTTIKRSPVNTFFYKYRSVWRNWELYLMLLPVIIFFLVFHYWPMYGVQIAFRDYNAVKGIWGSRWVGLKHVKRFVESYYFARLIGNTLGLTVYQLCVSMPLQVLLAILLNEIPNLRFKKLVQTVTYAPHFLSTVVLCGMVILFLSPRSGIINHIIALFGGERTNFIADPKAFRTIFVLSAVWQNTGYGSVVYVAALAGIAPELYEAATVDGANRFQKIWHISLPGILPTMITLLILRTGQLMNVGFEKAFLLQNDMNIERSEVISTYVYKSGLLNAQYSFSTAVGLFNSVVNFILIILVNAISKRVSETSLW